MLTPLYQNYNTPKNNVNFKAIPLAEYNYLKKDDKVTIYQLEKRDINYMKGIMDNLDSFEKKYDIDNESAKQVIEEALGAGIEILKETHHPEEKARVLTAFYDNEPSAILIGNALKIDKKGGFHYSSRKEHEPNETELDWLATWNKKIPGEGQAIVYEYFNTLADDGFKTCFVRSEIPQKSSAVNFYTRMGFKKLSNRPRAILRKNDNHYVIGKFDDKADKIIPMKATNIGDILAEKAAIVQRQEIEDKLSCKLPPESFECVA